MKTTWPMIPNSVTVRFRVVLIAVFTLGLIMALFAGWSFAGSAADEAFDRLLQSAAVQLFDGASTAGGHVEVLPPESAFDTLALAEDDRFFYSIRDPSGQLLTGYADLPEASANGRNPVAIVNRIYLGVPVRVITLRRPISTAKADGFLRVTVGQTQVGREAMQWKLFERSAPVTIGVAVLGLLGSLFAALIALRPLASLESALQQRSPQDLTPIHINGPRETEALVAAINALVYRIGLRLEKLQKFAGLAAHQLRTPLAAIGSQVDLLTNDDDEAIRSARVERLGVRLKELNRMIHQLLGHAMVAYRGDATPRRLVDLTQLTRAAARDAFAAQGCTRYDVGFQAEEEPLNILADDMMVREAILNLLNNAALHGATSKIRITVARDDGFAVVKVADDGPGIPSKDWADAGQPFTLKRQDDPGAGLGLSIVREIAVMHSGDLLFSDGDDGLFEVTLRLLAREGN